jgi:fructuronate reductase
VPESVPVSRLSRSTVDRPAPSPIRIAHLGLGAFARAHLGWYTAKAPDASSWGIAGFAGRSPDLARRLAPQDGLYTLVTRDGSGSTYDVLGALAEVHPAGDLEPWLALFAADDLAIASVTVTEAGYCRDAHGALDLPRDDIRRDLVALREMPSGAEGRPSTAPGRLVAGLAHRRRAGGGPLTLLSCDNLRTNGQVLHRVVSQLAAEVDPALAAWVEDQVCFPDSVVDRITPETVDADRAEVRSATGHQDDAPVVTEPYAEWVLQDAFPAGRPGWEAPGARFVDDVEPFESRKLLLLNGSHTIMALAGSTRGHETVADAISDPTCRRWVEQWWDEAQRHLSLPGQEITEYRTALLNRFANTAIQHRLSQIARDSSQKVPIRILPVLTAERSAGRLPEGAARAVAAWVVHLRGRGAPVHDPAADRLVPLVAGGLDDAVVSVLGELEPDLAADRELVAEVTRLGRQLDRPEH